MALGSEVSDNSAKSTSQKVKKCTANNSVIEKNFSDNGTIKGKL